MKKTNKETREKNKYLFYNENRNILCFTTINSNNNKEILIPGTPSFNPSNLEFNEKIINLLLNGNEVFLYRTKENRQIFNSKNGKLIKQEQKTVRNYYSCYKESDEKEQEEILELCYLYDFIPEYFSLEELINTKDIRNGDGLIMDRSFYEPLEELQKKVRV